MALNLSRNTRCWVTLADTMANATAENTYELGIQDGYSFGSQLNSTDVTVNEAGATPVRGSKRFNDSTNPVETRPAGHGYPGDADPSRISARDGRKTRSGQW